MGDIFLATTNKQDFRMAISNGVILKLEIIETDKAQKASKRILKHRRL